ncbi:MAG: two pore domain potassium channel family protein [Nitrosospira sp.]|nr:two pore domain potassium channel family protein [Nitrosospira sp.]
MIFTSIMSIFLVTLAVLIHYEALNKLSLVIPRIAYRHRIRILVGVFGALLAHVIEIWLFASAYYFMVHYGFGSLEGNFNKTFMDCSYFSFSTYTSLGYGDIEPIGDIRFLASLEALTGLLLIAWTASFMFMEMQKLWRDK